MEPRENPEPLSVPQEDPSRTTSAFPSQKSQRERVSLSPERASMHPNVASLQLESLLLQSRDSFCQEQSTPVYRQQSGGFGRTHFPFPVGIPCARAQIFQLPRACFLTYRTGVVTRLSQERTPVRLRPDMHRCFQDVLEAGFVVPVPWLVLHKERPRAGEAKRNSFHRVLS